MTGRVVMGANRMGKQKRGLRPQVVKEGAQRVRRGQHPGAAVRPRGCAAGFLITIAVNVGLFDVRAFIAVLAPSRAPIVYHLRQNQVGVAWA